MAGALYYKKHSIVLFMDIRVVIMRIIIVKLDIDGGHGVSFYRVGGGLSDA